MHGKMTATMNVISVFVLSLTCGILVVGRDLTLEPGHLKPFGFGISLPVEEVNKFPEPSDFFRKYVWPLKPVIMKGAAKISKAFDKWTDEYFLSLEGQQMEKVTVETQKKESRQQEVISLTFTDFVKTYNNSEIYMVNAVPGPLRQDVVIPCPLQCSEVISNNLVDDVMWFSSGGTKSVVHTDAVDNINCLYRGEKELFFIDPALYGDKVDIDRPEGAYSSMDVDSVDFTKYPGMADVEYYYVKLSAGDCLYIPYRWIHQVRSYGNNLAVNVWWKHYMSDNLNLDRCNSKCDLELTLSEAEFGGFDKVSGDPDEIRFYIKSLFTAKKNTINLLQFLKPLLGSEYKRLLKSSRKDDLVGLIQEIFILLDTDNDSLVTKEEVEQAETSVYVQIAHKLHVLEKVLEVMYDEINIDEEGDEEIDVDRDETDDDDLVGKNKDEL